MKNLELITYGVYCDLRTEVARRLLGFLWWIIEPVMYMAVFYVIFGLGLHQGDKAFVPFLLSGLIAWKWFDSSVRQASTSILNNAGLIQQVFIPKYIFACIQVLSNTVKFAIILSLFIVFLLATGFKPSKEWFGLLPLILAQAILIISLGLLLASLMPFVPDLKQVVDNLLMLLMFMSGVFFQASAAPESIQNLFALNPMLLLIDGYRAVLLHNQWPDWSKLGYVVSISMPFLMVGGLMLHRFERHYPKMLS